MSITDTFPIDADYSGVNPSRDRKGAGTLSQDIEFPKDTVI